MLKAVLITLNNYNEIQPLRGVTVIPYAMAEKQKHWFVYDKEDASKNEVLHQSDLEKKYEWVDVTRTDEVRLREDRPFEFDTFEDEEDDETRLRSYVSQALGAASMCWDPRPGDQVFESEIAKKIGDALMKKIDELRPPK